MPSFRIAFPNKYLKADDLGTTRPIGTIATVSLEDVGSGTTLERKLVVTFRESTLKGLVLNLINATTIAEIAACDDYDEWLGTRVVLYATRTEFQGKRVPCIRVAAPAPMPPRRTPPTPSVPTPPPEPPDWGDADIDTAVPAE